MLLTLLENGADPDALGRADEPPLARAVKRGDVSAVRILLDHGADPNGYDEPGYSFEDTGEDCVEPSDEERILVLEILIEAGADSDSLLRTAVSQRLPAGVDAALAAGADPNAGLPPSASEDEGGLDALFTGRAAGREASPLVLASMNGDERIVAMLLDAGVDPSRGVIVPAMSACFDVAARFEAIGGLVELTPVEQRPEELEFGSNPFVEGPLESPPLLEAAWNGNSTIVTMLLDVGADPNGIGAYGYTPLHAAASSGNAEIAFVLIQAGAAPPQTDAPLPSEIAEAAEHPEIADQLRPLETQAAAAAPAG